MVGAPQRANERRLTEGFARFFGTHRDVLVGIGDDAAVVRQRHERAVLCCDPVVHGVHFDESAPLHLVGQKAVNRNLSDLAAMGAVPDWLLLSIVAPRDMPWPDLRQLLAGVRRAARAADCLVVGGDLCANTGPLVVTVTAHGHLPGRALTRSGARIGDTLHVTGPLGGSRLGHHLRFRPLLAEGRWLAQQSHVRAMLDVSDGLLLDLATMLRSSSAGRSGQLGAELQAERIPLRAAAKQLAGGDGARALAHAFGDGEDHALLWAQRSNRELAAGGPLTARARRPIGTIVARPGLWLTRAGKMERLAIAGFEHRLGAGR